MTNLYIVSRHVHRYLVLIILGLLLVMAGTGLILRYPGWFEWLPSWLGMAKVRYLHGNVSTYFTIVLIIMALTGAYLYFYPLWQERRQKKAAHSANQPPPIS